MKAFKAYDIRGVYNRDFDKEDAYKVGFFLPQLLKAKKVLIGRDVRVSSDEIFDYLSRGITDCGADVYDLGLSTTPMVYYLTAKHNFEASVMITASHNAKEYNGLKVSRAQALPVGYDSGLSDLEEMMKTRELKPVAETGKIVDFDAKTEYLAFLMRYVPDFSNMKLAVDVSNGMAGLFVRELLGDEPSYIYEDLDGTFPNHEANPLIPENVADLKQLVLKEGADLGIIFDGDADRVMFVDEKGQFISPDLMIAVLGHYFLENQSGRVLQDIRSSKSVGNYIRKFGGEMHTWRVGRAYAALKLREIDGVFGGELAGHYYFRDFYYSDSAFMATLLILDVLSSFKRKGVTVSQLISSISSYENSGEINFRIEKKAEAMEAVKNHFVKTEKAEAIYDFDGYRVEFPAWWFSIRPSNTEPYLRLLVEAENKELLQEKVRKITEIIESV